MTKTLLATDAPWVLGDVAGTLLPPEFDLVAVERGEDVLPAFAEAGPDLIVLDLQIGSMGAAAIIGDLRNEFETGRLEKVPVLVLLDREADEWLARRLGADAWLLKPLQPGELVRRARLLVEEDQTREADGASDSTG